MWPKRGNEGPVWDFYGIYKDKETFSFSTRSQAASPTGQTTAHKRETDTERAQLRTGQKQRDSSRGCSKTGCARPSARL